MNAIDLFCGAGGFSAGLERAGIDVRYGFDLNERALETFAHNHRGTAVQHTITEEVPDEFQNLDVDLVFGSPPCKGFSDARGTRRLDDERNQLVFAFIQWVSQLQPAYVLMENVAGMTTISDEFLAAIEREYADAGYTVYWETLNAADFGVPQTRERVIYFGVRDDVDVTLRPPAGTHRDDGGTQLTLDGEQIPRWTTVREAIADLPEPTPEGEVTLPPLSEFPENEYLRTVRDGQTKTWNHTAKEPADDADAQHIVAELNPGEMYRSSRFGDRYRQVWELLSHRFTPVEQDILQFVARHRSRKEFRITGKSVGPVAEHRIIEGLSHESAEITDALEHLYNDGWLRTKTVDDIRGYDLNTKSGIRPRYMRLDPGGQSNTILTTDFNPRDKLHPTKNRGLSLREGARIQSFPDSFEFRGTFDEIATQIGNAVPPLMAQRIAEHLIDTDARSEGRVTATE